MSAINPIPRILSQHTVSTVEASPKKKRVREEKVAKDQKTRALFFENQPIPGKTTTCALKRVIRPKIVHEGLPVLRVTMKDENKQLVLEKDHQKEKEKDPLIPIPNSPILDEVIYQQNLILQNYQVSSKGILIRARVITGLTAEMLKQIIQVAIKNYLPKEQSPLYVKFSHLSLNFLAKREGQLLKLHFIGAMIGKGTFGVVFSTLSLHSGIDQAFKVALPKIPDSKKNVLNEMEKLLKIHSDGNVWGIQSKPREVVNISKDNEIGFLMERYEKDYLNVINTRHRVQQGSNTKPNLVSFEKSLVEIHQLLYGLYFLHLKGYVHRDIKLENILTKSDELGLIVHIADFGGVSQMSVGEPFPEVASPAYIHEEDLVKIYLICQSHLTNKHDFLYQIGRQHDVFALGCVIYSSLIGQHPFSTKSEAGCPIKQCTPMPEDKAPQTLRTLIESMLAVDLNLRPTAKEAYETFDQFLKNGPYTQLHTLIHQKMEKDYKLHLPKQSVTA